MQKKQEVWASQWFPEYKLPRQAHGMFIREFCWSSGGGSGNWRVPAGLHRCTVAEPVVAAVAPHTRPHYI